jgi:hypothetical protein
MARKDIRNRIAERMLGHAYLESTRKVVNELIQAGGTVDELQSLYDLRGMLSKLAAEPTK